MANECLFQYSEEQFLQLESEITLLKRQNKILDEKIESIDILRKKLKIYQAEHDNQEIKSTRHLNQKIEQFKRANGKSIERFNYLETVGKQRLELAMTDSNRGILSVFSKDERKSFHFLRQTLQKLFDLEREIEIILEENQKIENDHGKIMKEKITPLLVQLRESQTKYKDYVKEVKQNNDKLNFLRIEWTNQLIVRKCLPYAIENHVHINNEHDGDIDGYDELLEKCILDYADTMVYSGIMAPLCTNQQCDGVEIGNSCNCGRNKNIWFTTVKPEYGNYIEVKDTFFLPELDRQLVYLIERDSSIDEYIAYADEHDILYANYDELFIECNTYHYNFLCSLFFIPCEEFPTSYSSDDEHSVDCVFWPQGNDWHCECGRGDFVFEFNDFDPREFSITETKPGGYLRNGN